MEVSKVKQQTILGQCRHLSIILYTLDFNSVSSTVVNLLVRQRFPSNFFLSNCFNNLIFRYISTQQNREWFKNLNECLYDGPWTGLSGCVTVTVDYKSHPNQSCSTMKLIDRGELGRIHAAAAISRSGLGYIKFIIYE